MNLGLKLTRNLRTQENYHLHKYSLWVWETRFRTLKSRHFYEHQYELDRFFEEEKYACTGHKYVTE